MTTRRTFLHATLGAVAATTAAGRVHHVLAQGPYSGVRTRDGINLFVKDSGGTGRAVVMTHAWPLNADVWDYQAAQLSKAGFRVITYDRRGFGRSNKPGSGYDFDTFADDLAAVIEQTGVRDATLVGYSMGGGEVVRYFSRHRGRNIAKACLVGAAARYLLKTENNPIGIDGAVFDGIKQGVQGDRKTFLAGLLRDVFLDGKLPATDAVTQELVDATLTMAMQASVVATTACVDAFARTDFRPELAAVKVPTLVLHGTSDIAVPFAIGKAAADGIAQSRLIEYRDASHGIVLTERDRVTRDLQAFIAS
ncbi:MAG: alpha/beta hydrolase [bacterium]|nr:alpha/beta hydrolase [bacterium]